MTQGPRRLNKSQNARENGRSFSYRNKKDSAYQEQNPSRPALHVNTHKNTAAGLASNEQTPAISDSCMRLNKALASAGLCSRRQADVLIERGLVTVNGSIVTEMGCKVDMASDAIVVEGRPLPRKSQASAFTYILLNKPVQVVTTVSDPQGRETVIDLLPTSLRQQRLFPVGRLDYFSEGLLLLTDDGELTNRLTHPRWHLPKVYHVRVRGNVSSQKMALMRAGMQLAEGERLAPVEVQRLSEDRNSSLIQLTLHQGINRQIRRMCRDLDLIVLRLSRVAQGPLQLGGLDTGHCRTLTVREINELRHAVGLA